MRYAKAPHSNSGNRMMAIETCDVRLRIKTCTSRGKDKLLRKGDGHARQSRIVLANSFLCKQRALSFAIKVYANTDLQMACECA